MSDPIDPTPLDPPAVSLSPATPAEPTRRQRIMRRVLRRPTQWLMAPWPAERMVQYFTVVALLGGATFAVLKVIHLDLVFQNNTPTGGDMGAHVMAPAYLRDHLLPSGQISGWNNYWYNGFPLYRFYMVVPALMIVALNVLLPYGVAFKVITCLGLVTLPFCCWAFGRLARFRYPVPELMALAAMLFLFDESFKIYGGNVKSTMAGEFSFSIALSFAILGLGLFARGLETGKYRNWTAIVLALAMLSHGIVLIFVVLAALLLWLVWMDRTRFIYGLTMGITAVMLSAFWVLPFLFNHAYMTDMKYGSLPSGANDSFWDMFFQWPPFLDIVVSGFALAGFAICVARRHLNGAWLGILCFALMAATYLAQDSLPIIGLLWNPRILPFLYLVRLLLAMVGVVEVVHLAIRGWQARDLSYRQTVVAGAVTAGSIGLVVLVGTLFLFREVPGGRYVTKNGKSVYSWGIGGWDPISLTPTSSDAQSDGWTRYNFMGYEGRDAYGEYKALVDTMASLGNDDDPELGCGRAMWENNGDTGAYGTTMALMLLPHWTDGCIASQEGLFFEASGTTPYHFLSAAAMSKNSSNPVRELRYVDNDASIGVPMLQKLGVKYAMVFTADAKREADANTDLTLVAESGPWKIYRVANSDVVVPLTVQPVVVAQRSGDQRERNLELGTSWFQNTDEWAAIPADDGPAEWQRIEVQVDYDRQVGAAPMEPGRKVDIVVPAETIKQVDLPAIEVSNYRLGEQDLSFDVSEIGVPVLVKVSYFPNWQVDGAKGPYRVAPNLMVVIPTSTHVHMHYESSTTDKLFMVVSFLGLGLMVFWRRRGDIEHGSPHPFVPAAGGPSDDDTGELEEWTDEVGQLDEPGVPGEGAEAAGSWPPPPEPAESTPDSV